MKVGVISDTHDHATNIIKAIQYLNQQEVAVIYHCGDWVSPFIFELIFWEAKPKAPVKGVLGNNEGDRYRIVQRILEHKLPITLEQHLLEDEIDGRKIAVYHGQDKKITQSLLESQKYDAVFTGHTHDQLTKTVGKTLHLNPGTVCEAAHSKIINNPSIAIYDTKSNSTQIVEFLKEV